MRPGNDGSFHPRPGLALLLTVLALASLPAFAGAEPIHVRTRASTSTPNGAQANAVTVANFNTGSANTMSTKVQPAESERSPYQHQCGDPPPGVPEPGAGSLALAALGALWVARSIRKIRRAVGQG